jgi:TMAO reductase system protein TorT
MRRWLLAGILSVAACVGVAGCGGSDNESTAGGGGGDGGKDLTIGFSAPDLNESFWVSMAYGIDQEAKKLGVEVIRVSAGGDANANQQISQLQDLLQRNVDGLIVGATDGDAVRSVVDQASSQNVPVVGLSSIPNSDKIASAVGADHYGMGKIQAQCLGGALNGKGEVAMLGGPAGQSWADNRVKGFKETLAKEFPGIKIAAVSRLADNRNAAVTTTEDWIQRFPSLSGIYSATDDIGSGAVDAIKAARKLDQIKVTSSNFSPAAEQLLKDGTFVCVSVQEIVQQGREAVQQAVNAAEDKQVEKDVVTPVVKITKSNIDSVDFGPIRAPEGYKP